VSREKKNGRAILVYGFLGLYDGTNTLTNKEEQRKREKEETRRDRQDR